MSRLAGFTLLLAGAAGFAFAGTSPAPEIDANAAVGAVSLLAGSLLVLRARRRAK